MQTLIQNLKNYNFSLLPTFEVAANPKKKCYECC